MRGSKTLFSFLKLTMHGKIQGDPLHNRVAKFQTIGKGEETKNKNIKNEAINAKAKGKKKSYN